jgi:hypothetical protein
LELVSKVGSCHKHIPYGLAILSKQHGYKGKNSFKFPAYSGGFDCEILSTDIAKGVVEKRTEINTLLAIQIGVRLRTPAHIYSVFANPETHELLLSLETGHLMSLKSKNTKQVRFYIDAHAHRILHR